MRLIDLSASIVRVTGIGDIDGPPRDGESPRPAELGSMPVDWTAAWVITGARGVATDRTIRLLIRRIRTASIRVGLGPGDESASTRSPSTPSTEPCARRRSALQHVIVVAIVVIVVTVVVCHAPIPFPPGGSASIHIPRRCSTSATATAAPSSRASIATLTVSRSISSTLRRPSATSAAHGARRLPGRGR